MCNMRKCSDDNNNIYVAFLWIHSTPIDPGLLSSCIAVQQTIKRLNAQLNRLPIQFDHDGDLYDASKKATES